jgi:hypothetical protein
MKSVDEIGKDLEKFSKKLHQNLIQAQRETAEKIQTDARNFSPKPNGDYAQSIKLSDTETNDDKITTWIHTDMKSEDGHFIGRMIENGTGIYALEPHIGKTKTFFASGYQYWYVPTTKVKHPIGQEIEINGVSYYVAKAQRPKPHFKPALNQNIVTYRNNLKEAVRRSK